MLVSQVLPSVMDLRRLLAGHLRLRHHFQFLGQRAPHGPSTRDSSPVRHTLPPPSYHRTSGNDGRRSPSRRSQSFDNTYKEYLDRDRGRDRLGS
ncbi:hypothetical protein HS088_TW13G00738 [Tripterygium wilfordii]|uniref:Uncharacterized protein n=1 Tax=Tripterygium wilfordii TaxID=458696 RepID=A0A7J7CUR9_TRIWF|nr:hypothetical protein HS088_TW13G00738 [Tripterygium wilfordii]